MEEQVQSYEREGQDPGLFTMYYSQIKEMEKEALFNDTSAQVISKSRRNKYTQCDAFFEKQSAEMKKREENVNNFLSGCIGVERIKRMQKEGEIRGSKKYTGKLVNKNENSKMVQVRQGQNNKSKASDVSMINDKSQQTQQKTKPYQKDSNKKCSQNNKINKMAPNFKNMQNLSNSQKQHEYQTQTSQQKTQSLEEQNHQNKRILSNKRINQFQFQNHKPNANSFQQQKHSNPQTSKITDKENIEIFNKKTVVRNSHKFSNLPQIYNNNHSIKSMIIANIDNSTSICLQGVHSKIYTEHDKRNIRLGHIFRAKDKNFSCFSPKQSKENEQFFKKYNSISKYKRVVKINIGEHANNQFMQSWTQRKRELLFKIKQSEMQHQLKYNQQQKMVSNLHQLPKLKIYLNMKVDDNNKRNTQI